MKLPVDGNGIGLPVGALAAHCVLSIGNDVGPVVRNDVVVVLSIGGQSLGRTGHLALRNTRTDKERDVGGLFPARFV